MGRKAIVVDLRHLKSMTPGCHGPHWSYRNRMVSNRSRCYCQPLCSSTASSWTSKCDVGHRAGSTAFQRRLLPLSHHRPCSSWTRRYVVVLDQRIPGRRQAEPAANMATFMLAFKLTLYLCMPVATYLCGASGFGIAPQITASMGEFTLCHFALTNFNANRYAAFNRIPHFVRCAVF